MQELRTIEEEKTKVVLMSAEAEAQRVVFLEGEMKRAEALEEELLSREEEELRLREERRRLVEAGQAENRTIPSLENPTGVEAASEHRLSDISCSTRHAVFSVAGLCPSQDA